MFHQRPSLRMFKEHAVSSGSSQLLHLPFPKILGGKTLTKTAENQSQTWRFWNNGWLKPAYFFRSIPGIQWIFLRPSDLSGLSWWLGRSSRRTSPTWGAADTDMACLFMFHWVFLMGVPGSKISMVKDLKVGIWIVWISRFPVILFPTSLWKGNLQPFSLSKWTVPYRTQSARKDEAHWEVI